jgi:hypothetical protein
MQPKKRRVKAKGADKRDGQMRLTIWLPSERARLVKSCAAFHGLENGEVLDRGVDAALAGFYVAHRKGTGPEGGETTSQPSAQPRTDS